MIVFKNHLNKLKIYLLLFLTKYRIYMFLIKFKLNLKVKILDIDNVSNICNKLLAIIIIQKQTLNCICEVNVSNFNN